MDTPDNLRRLAESEALKESLQTMEYLTEFPALEERRDFRRFPPQYGDPHYHPSRLKKNGDGRPQRREEARVPAVGPFPERETRRNVFGLGGFMSPMRRVAEAAHRVPEVQDINITEIPRDPTDTNIMEQENEGWDIIPELSQPIEEVLPSAVGQQTSVRDDTIREPEMVVEHIPLIIKWRTTYFKGRTWDRHHKYSSHNNFCNYYCHYSQRVNISVFYTSSQFHRHGRRSTSP